MHAGKSVHRGSWLLEWYVDVDGGGGQRFVAHEFFDDQGVDAGFVEGGAEPVTEGVRRAGDAGAVHDVGDGG